MALMLQRNVQLFPQFWIQNQNANPMMTFRADADMVPGVIEIHWIRQIITQCIILHLFADDGI